MPLRWGNSSRGPSGGAGGRALARILVFGGARAHSRAAHACMCQHASARVAKGFAGRAAGMCVSATSTSLCAERACVCACMRCQRACIRASERESELLRARTRDCHASSPSGQRENGRTDGRASGRASGRAPAGKRARLRVCDLLFVWSACAPVCVRVCASGPARPCGQRAAASTGSRALRTQGNKRRTQNFEISRLQQRAASPAKTPGVAKPCEIVRALLQIVRATRIKQRAMVRDLFEIVRWRKTEVAPLEGPQRP